MRKEMRKWILYQLRSSSLWPFTELQRTKDELQRMRDRYLSLIADSLLGIIYEDPGIPLFGEEIGFNKELREYGGDWPSRSCTMIGAKRMANVRMLVENVIQNRIPGDLIETGVWRGGACIFMRAILTAYNITDRRVWVADSFEGLPPPNPEQYPSDEGSIFHTFTELAVSVEEVRNNFEKYGLLDEQVVFLKGMFQSTLPNAPVERLALLRIDGDMYESTIVPLNSLYDKVSIGGYIILDDHFLVQPANEAFQDFIAARKISPQLFEIDGVGAYWQKTSA